MGRGSTDYSELEARIGHGFSDKSLLIKALTHPSYSQQFPDEAPDNNQRMEFLGDSVLALILSDALFHKFQSKREGVLTRNRSALARGPHLARMSADMGLGEFLLLGDGEETNKGRTRESILEDALEALIGAIYLDADFETARTIVLGWYGDLEQQLDQMIGNHNPKGRLQEMLQPVHGNNAITYAVVGEDGPDHSKLFQIEVLLLGKSYGTGTGTSKKEAEEEAARQALLKLESHPLDLDT
jgi:ribonuclease III